MKLWYSDDGTILKLTDDAAEGTGNFIILADNKVTEDIKTTFALGRYTIKNNKISKKTTVTVKTELPDDHPLKYMANIYLEHPPAEPK